ncbi:RNA polymerase sigma factor [Desulfoscipio gibsoniae]|uniref:RNA polymerase sigma factor, sigma-70 family n=1 Tax=Desulfoscipio gibsoniae DSM 7213 TaxID=767817 RepID=R4KL09_9FIRM|nr:RNA polymerase sigma factor [Desulfoscipio gibsoniae]AGL02262.1 RNA polymerase sigma factor, sigma-70 family [Desulfoscipio gibsoniae DSM 7213]
MTASAMEKIYHHYSGPVFRYFYRMGGDYNLAEELTQETFYRVLVSLKRYRGESTLSTWLFRIAFHVYTVNLRSHFRSRCLPLDQDIPDMGRFGDPVRSLEKAENHQLISLALQQLPAGYRTVIVLRIFEGLSFEEIGAVLNKSPSTTRVALSRARQRYRQVYNQLANGYSD